MSNDELKIMELLKNNQNASGSYRILESVKDFFEKEKRKFDIYQNILKSTMIERDLELFKGIDKIYHFIKTSNDLIEITLQHYNPMSIAKDDLDKRKSELKHINVEYCANYEIELLKNSDIIFLEIKNKTVKIINYTDCDVEFIKYLITYNKYLWEEIVRVVENHSYGFEDYIIKSIDNSIELFCTVTHMTYSVKYKNTYFDIHRLYGNKNEIVIDTNSLNLQQSFMKQYDYIMSCLENKQIDRKEIPVRVREFRKVNNI